MDTSSNLEFLWWHMRGDFGWLMATISWATALRIGFKPLNGFFHDYIASRPAAQTAWAQKLFGSAWWGFIAFTLDYIASIKLPRGKNGTGNTEFIKKDAPPNP